MSQYLLIIENTKVLKKEYVYFDANNASEAEGVRESFQKTNTHKDSIIKLFVEIKKWEAPK